MPFFGLSSAQKTSEVGICARMSVLYFIVNSLHLTSKGCKMLFYMRKKQLGSGENNELVYLYVWVWLIKTEQELQYLYF